MQMQAFLILPKSVGFVNSSVCTFFGAAYIGEAFFGVVIVYGNQVFWGIRGTGKTVPYDFSFLSCIMHAFTGARGGVFEKMHPQSVWR